MVWQDTVILFLNMIFGVMLIPQILELHRKKTSMNLATCTTTLAALIILGITYATLNFWLAVTGDLIDIGAWGLLVGFSVRNRRM